MFCIVCSDVLITYHKKTTLQKKPGEPILRILLSDSAKKEQVQSKISQHENTRFFLLLISMLADFYVSYKNHAAMAAETMHRVHTEWQWPFLAYIPPHHGKLALAGECGGGCTPIPFHFIYHHVQS
jgi:hypothetical protein